MSIFKDYRKRNGYTQEDLALKLHLNQATVSKWEKGKSLPDIETLIKLAELYRCRVDDLLCRDICEQKEPETIESVIGFQSQSHKECIELINQLTESQALKLCGYIERMLEDEQNKKEKLNKGEN